MKIIQLRVNRTHCFGYNLESPRKHKIKMFCWNLLKFSMVNVLHDLKTFSYYLNSETEQNDLKAKHMTSYVIVKLIFTSLPAIFVGCLYK